VQKDHEQISWTTKRTSAICTEIDARSDNLVKNAVIRYRSGESVNVTLQLRLVFAYGRLTGSLAGKTESAPQARRVLKSLKLKRFSVFSGVRTASSD